MKFFLGGSPVETDNKRWSQKRLRVIGALTFQFLKEDSQLLPEHLQKCIQEADKLAPWVSKESREHQPWVEVIKSEKGVVIINVTPQFAVYSRQLEAFHSYLCRIARHIAGMNIQEIVWVDVSMVVNDDSGDFRFLTSAGEEISTQIEGAIRETLQEFESAPETRFLSIETAASIKRLDEFTWHISMISPTGVELRQEFTDACWKDVLKYARATLGTRQGVGREYRIDHVNIFGKPDAAPAPYCDGFQKNPDEWVSGHHFVVR